MTRDYSRREVLGIIEAEARERGIPRDDFLRFAYIETGGTFDESVSRGPNGAKGLFQFVPSTAAQYGIGGRELDPVANTDAAARLYLDNRQALVARHGRDGRPYLSGNAEPDGLDMYMAHQQGVGGYRSIQAAVATGSFSRTDTRGNIVNNVSARDFQQVTGIEYASFVRMGDRDMAQAFTRYWDTKFDRVRIPEMGIEPVAAQAQRRTADATPEPARVPPNGEGRWPAPGNTSINEADRPGEGRGEFGTSRGGGARRHGGVDIQGNVGDPIAAYAAGTVRVQPNNGAAGNTVTIDHGNGVVTRYFHLDSIGVRDGQRVEAGDQVGTMGRTGNTPRQGDTHLHFEMLRDGQRVDPMQYLQVPGREQRTGGQTRSTDPMADGMLRRDERGPDVAGLQRSLNALGVRDAQGNRLGEDGVLGQRTEEAVRAFQREYGLRVDGVAGPRTLAAIGTLLPPGSVTIERAEITGPADGRRTEGAGRTDPSPRTPLVSEAAHPNHALFAAIQRQLPEGTRPEAIANITLQALENGITSPDRLRGVAVSGSNVHLQGPFEGSRVSVDLNAPTPDLRAMSDHMARQSEELAREQRVREPDQRQLPQVVSV